MEVAALGAVVKRGVWGVEPHFADHGEDGWDGGCGVGHEGDVEDGGGVDEGVDGWGVIGCWVESVIRVVRSKAL